MARHHDVRHGDRGMTQITLQNGSVVLRDSKVGTEQNCCCEECHGSCDTGVDCAPGCCCATTWTGESPGSLVKACRRTADGYACCCDSYKKLCFVDKTEIVPHDGGLNCENPIVPDIPGSPPPNAIVLVNANVVYCEVNRDIIGSLVDPTFCDEAIYEYGYYYVVDNCDECEGTCYDWFGESFVPQFWQSFCDCATHNSVDLCEDNPLP